MTARLLGTVFLLGALLLERFAYYGFRAQFLMVLVARGVLRSEAVALFSTFTTLVMVVPLVFAGLAVVTPRVWLAPAGGLVALAGYLAAIAGPPDSFPVGVMLIAVGVAAMKVTIVCAAADFVESARARTVVGALGYGVINAGVMLAPLVTGASGAEGFSRAPVVATVLLMLLCGAAVAVAVAVPRVPATGQPTARGLLGVLLLLPVSTFLWSMVEVQSWDLDLPSWVHLVNPLLVVPASLVVGFALGLVPARVLPWSVIGVLVLSFVLAASGGLGVKSRDPFMVVGMQVLLSAAEIGLGMLVFALAVGNTPPRFAPLAVALLSGVSAVSNLVATRLDTVRLPVLVGLGVVSVFSLAVFVGFFRVTLGALGRPEPVHAALPPVHGG